MPDGFRLDSFLPYALNRAAEYDRRIEVRLGTDQTRALKAALARLAGG